MRTVVIGTAGHIDHGKSALIEALTGIHPDRLKEERERGITIDLGFASLVLQKDLQIGFVDVPGHERFIKNMLAGVGGIDAILLVISADESVMPQTREHVEICELLKIPAGVVIISKVDLVQPEFLDLVKIEVQEFLKGSFLEGAPVIPISARLGQGIEETKGALYKLCQQIPAKPVLNSPRLPIDRVFSLRGYGTIVTGTLISGSLYKDEEVEVSPTGLKARIRGIQVHEASTNQAVAGQRTAVNLHGLEVHQIRRGMELVESRRFTPIRVFEAQVEVLGSSPVPIRKGMRVRFHHGTSEIMGKMTPFASIEIKPGESGIARVSLDEGTLLIPRDRFIFRRVSPLATLGGGMVLDIGPSRTKRFLNESIQGFLEAVAKGRLDEMILYLAKKNYRLGVCENELLAQSLCPKSYMQKLVNQLVADGRLILLSADPMVVMDAHTFDQLSGEVCQALKQYHEQEPLSIGLAKEQLTSRIFKGCHPDAAARVFESLLKSNKIEIEQEKVRLPGHRVKLSQSEGSAKDDIERAFLQAGWKVPLSEEILLTLSIPRSQAKTLLAMLIREKKLVKISETLVFHSTSISQLKQILAGYKKSSDQIDVGKFKELIGVSRKYAIPLLEYLDRERITRRVGDIRILL